MRSRHRFDEYGEAMHDRVNIGADQIESVRFGQVKKLLEKALQPFCLAVQHIDPKEAPAAHVVEMMLFVGEILGEQLQVDHQCREGVSQFVGEPPDEFGDLRDGSMVGGVG